MTAPQYQRYPMVMRHPGQRAAVISQWDEKLKRHVPEHGEPAKFQPVTVHNADDEEYHAAQGYRPLGGDAQTFTQQVNDNIVNPKPAGYSFSEYPKWVDGVLVQDPAKPVTTFQEYPKWVGDVLVGSAAEEAALKTSSTPAIEQPIAAAAPAPALQEVVIDGVTYCVPPAVAAQLLAKQSASTASSEAPPAKALTPIDDAAATPTLTPKKAPRATKAAQEAGAAPKTPRRSYRDRTGAAASSADAVA